MVTDRPLNTVGLNSSTPRYALPPSEVISLTPATCSGAVNVASRRPLADRSTCVSPRRLSVYVTAGLSLREPAWRAPEIRADDVSSISRIRTLAAGSVVPSDVPV